MEQQKLPSNLNQYDEYGKLVDSRIAEDYEQASQ